MAKRKTTSIQEQLEQVQSKMEQLINDLSIIEMNFRETPRMKISKIRGLLTNARNKTLDFKVRRQAHIDRKKAAV